MLIYFNVFGSMNSTIENVGRVQVWRLMDIFYFFSSLYLLRSSLHVFSFWVNHRSEYGILFQLCKVKSWVEKNNSNSMVSIEENGINPKWIGVLSWIGFNAKKFNGKNIVIWNNKNQITKFRSFQLKKKLIILSELQVHKLHCDMIIW